MRDLEGGGVERCKHGCGMDGRGDGKEIVWVGGWVGGWIDEWAGWINGWVGWVGWVGWMGWMGGLDG